MGESVSLNDWLQQEGAPPPLARLVLHVAGACAEIAAALRVTSLTGQTGALDSVNVQGETQKALDVVSNEIFLAAGHRSGVLAAMASEEMDEVVAVDAPGARYALLFDPLDGSSNLDVNVTVGSIFSVVEADAASILKPGSAQVAAGYAAYGPATVLVLTVGNGVSEFTLDPGGAWRLSARDMRIPAATTEFAINTSRAELWEEPVKAYIAGCVSGAYGKRFNMRWIASMVADVHRIIKRGGIFLYPLDSETRTKGGKLRLMYEANPMGMIAVKAGGGASTGRGPILELEPEALHQRVPVVIGSIDEVRRVEALHRG